MRHDEVHVLHRPPGPRDRFANQSGNRPHGQLEHRLPIHVSAVKFAVDRLARHGHARAAGGHFQDIPGRPVCAHHACVDPAAGVRCAKHGGARAVADQHARGPVFPVDEPAQRLRTDDQRRAGEARREHLPGRDQAIDETRACGEQVKRTGLRGAQPLLQQTGGRGKEHVRRGRPHQDQVEVLRADGGGVQGLLRGDDCEVRGRLVGAGDMPALDPSPRRDPLVAGVNQARQVVVGQHLRRCIGAQTQDGRARLSDSVDGHGGQFGGRRRTPHRTGRTFAP